jgi:cytochrome c553
MANLAGSGKASGNDRADSDHDHGKGDQRAPVPPYKSFPKDVVQRGSRIAQQGLSEARVQACTTCHGPLGQGSPPDIPYIAGQAPGYIKDALQAFESGKRKSDPYKTMRHVAGGLSDEDIHALAAYFSTLPPPGAHGNEPLSLANEKPEQP